MNFLKRIVKTIIPEYYSGKTLSDFLAERFSYHSEAEWRRLITESFVLLNGAKTRPDNLIKNGDCVEYDVSSFEEPPVDLTFKIIFENENYLIVDKSGNLPVHPAGPFFRNTLWRILSEQYGKIHFLNRIDRESSGLVLVAKNPETAANFANLNSSGQVIKRYIVIVSGAFNYDEIRAEGFIIKDAESKIRKKRKFVSVAAIPCPQAENACTIFRKITVCDEFSVIEAELKTGRTHQIRAALLALGHPVIGDKIYGQNEMFYLKFTNDSLNEEDISVLKTKRQMLHSAMIRFKIGQDASPTTFSSPLHQDMREFIEKTPPMLLYGKYKL
jgi:23S rRNA pseudouridine955/2504/2580 synthase/23S rRNA pseudouridine1911/1915/1917 synthase